MEGACERSEMIVQHMHPEKPYSSVLDPEEVQSLLIPRMVILIPTVCRALFWRMKHPQGPKQMARILALTELSFGQEEILSNCSSSVSSLLSLQDLCPWFSLCGSASPHFPWSDLRSHLLKEALPDHPA